MLVKIYVFVLVGLSYVMCWGLCVLAFTVHLRGKIFMFLTRFCDVFVGSCLHVLHLWGVAQALVEIFSCTASKHESHEIIVPQKLPVIQ